MGKQAGAPRGARPGAAQAARPERPQPPAWESYRAAALVALVATAAAALLVEAARGDSVTVDEFAHLPAGLFYLHTGHFSVYNLSPPLLRLWCALPVWWVGATADFAHALTDPNQWALGGDFMARNADRYQELFVLGRLPAILLTLVLIGVVFRSGGRLLGVAAGVTAAVLCGFCPNILAHGHLVTTDVGHTLLFFAAVMAWERVLRRPSPAATVLAGVVLGLAQLTKFSALLLYPLDALLAVVACRSGAAAARVWRSFAAGVALSLIVLNAGYLFSGMGGSLRQYTLKTAAMRALAASPLGGLPLPLPEDFVRGYDAQLAEAQSHYTVFFHGELSEKGWWYYYLAAFVLKTPMPTLVLLLAGAVGWLGAGRWRTEPLTTAVLFVPPVVYVGALSLLTDINLGLRYILPAYPFLWLIAGSVWNQRWTRQPAGRALLVALLAAQVLVALRARPYYLSYFNALAGGSENGRYWLVDSNLDWGQDLLRLRDYLRTRGNPHVRLAYFGSTAPELYDIDYEVFTQPGAPGVYVVSANYLMGRPYFLYDHGSLRWVEGDGYRRFRDYQPTAVIGQTLFVFDLRAGNVPAPG
jgi:hypothetical protein